NVLRAVAANVGCGAVLPSGLVPTPVASLLRTRARRRGIRSPRRRIDLTRTDSADQICVDQWRVSRWPSWPSSLPWPLVGRLSARPMAQAMEEPQAGHF